jgi:SAM-dependent methyltransferase
MTDDASPATPAPRSWKDWHTHYESPDSPLSTRLAAVRERIRIALDEAPEGPLKVLSLCAGEGRDLIPVLADHPRRADVTARLVEFDPDIAGVARTAAADAGLTGVEVVTGDAALTDQYLGLAPADLVLLCGIFGNVSPDDIKNTVQQSAALTARGGTVIWTRHRREPNLFPTVAEWFAESGFAELWRSATDLESAIGVGAHRQERDPLPLDAGRKLFTFVTKTWR